MATPYDPLYLEGIECFNRREYFESHEVWESLWIKERGASKLVYKGLIQAAVALHHINRGNRAGAKTLLARSHSYLEFYRPKHQGLDLEEFLTRLDDCVKAGIRTAAESQNTLAAQVMPPVICLDATGASQ
jgi:uncharacterized protein